VACEGGLPWCLRYRSYPHARMCVFAEAAGVSKPTVPIRWRGMEDGRDLIDVATLEFRPCWCLSASGGRSGGNRRRSNERQVAVVMTCAGAEQRG
jgi:hypothetical protein